MRCRPWRWLWGFLPLALIVYLAAIGERARVERDLTVRTEQALQSAGFRWAKPRFEGRDGILEGVARSEGERVHAMDIVRSVHGVRVVSDASSVVAEVSPYSWSATLTAGGLVLKGYVPDSASRKAIIGFAKARFPSRAIDDQMKQGAGAPDNGIWLGGVSFAFRQLGGLRTGMVALSDTALEVEGEARSPQSYARIRNALANKRPQGISLDRQAIRAPVVSPYAWSFDRLDNVVVLNGYVPGEKFRARLLAEARTRYPEARIADRMIVARGAPEGFRKAAIAALKSTGDLVEVRVAIKDQTITLTGLGESADRVARARAAMSAASGGLKVTNRLRVLEVTPPRADPFVWSARIEDDVVILSGHVPDEAARTRIVAAATREFPNRPVTDAMTLASGVPGQTGDWIQAAEFGISGLIGLGDGRATLNGTELTITGSSASSDSRASRENAVKNALPTGFAGQLDIEYIRQPEPTFVWQATRNDKQVILSGNVPDDETRRSLINEAVAAFPGLRVVDKMSVIAGPSDRWGVAASHGIQMLARLDFGFARLEGTNLVVSGASSVEQKADAVRSAVTRRALPQGYSARERVRHEPVEVTPEIDLAALERQKIALAAKREAERKAEAAKIELERARLAAVKAAEAAAAKREQERLAAEDKARKAMQVAERRLKARRIREAAIEASRLEAERRVAEQRKAERARRMALRAEYQLLSEYNGTPLQLWKARDEARDEGNTLGDNDVAKFDDLSARSRGRLWLRGKVASKIHRDLILNTARNNFDGEIDEDLEVLDGEPDGNWLEAATAGLTQLSSLRNGALSVTQGNLELYGDAISDDAARATRRQIDRQASNKFKVASLITAPRVLKKTDVEVALKQSGNVDAGECGNLMNALTSLDPIRFDVASAVIKPSAKPTIEKLGAVALKCPRTRVRIFGHTDSNGKSEYNQELSEQRADAILTYLTERGVSRERLTARGFGETRPLVRNTTPEQRAKNRRIEFVVTDK